MREWKLDVAVGSIDPVFSPRVLLNSVGAWNDGP